MVPKHLAIATARELFPGAKRWTYMDVSLRGLLANPVRQAVDRFLDQHQSGEWYKQDLLDTAERARQLFAKLTNAHPDEIALTKNASEGLNAIATALPWEAGDNVVLCSELEHPNNVYPWLNLERRFGIEVRNLEPKQGHIPVDEFVAAIDGRTRLVTVPTVTFSPGFVTELGPISRACREQDAFFLVDAAQSIGLIETDVHGLGLDGLATGTQKGLLAFYGSGYMYCRREWAERIQPVYLARYGVALGGDAHETAMDRSNLTFAKGARRFDLGNYNYIGATAVAASIELLLDIGITNIERHVRALSRRLASGIRDIGLDVAGGDPGPHLGHIVAVGKSGGGRHYTAEDPAMNSLHEHLSANDVRLAIRRGVLRFSLHVYNTEDDVDRVLQLTRDWYSSRPR
jgi:cysteine desulfurase/selenocysteine lyase